MKSEHRHELKTNELAEWINNFPQWAKQNTKTIIYISVVILGVAGLYIWKNYQKNVVSVKKQSDFTNILSTLPQAKLQIIQAQMQGFDSSYILIQTAEALQSTAQNATNDQMAALALIKRAQARRTELHYRFGAISEQDKTAQLDLAQASYGEALIKAQGNPSLTAAAKFGIGLCREERAEFDKAEQIYRDIIENPDLEVTVAAAQAKMRLETMANYQQKIVLKASPKPVLTKPVKPKNKFDQQKNEKTLKNK